MGTITQNITDSVYNIPITQMPDGNHITQDSSTTLQSLDRILTTTIQDTVSTTGMQNTFLTTGMQNTFLTSVMQNISSTTIKTFQTTKQEADDSSVSLTIGLSLGIFAALAMLILVVIFFTRREINQAKKKPPTKFDLSGLEKNTKSMSKA
jgi:hypothetical protein